MTARIDVGFLVAQKRTGHPGWAWKPGRVTVATWSKTGFRPRNLRLRVLSLVTGPRTPSLAVGVAVAGSLLVVETLAVCSLNVLTGMTGRVGTLYVLGVLIVSMVWGFGLSLAMSVASAVAFTYFRNWPDGQFAPFQPENWLLFAVFLALALVANALAGLARVGERFFDLSPDLLCIADAERIIRVNPAFSQILGYSIDDLA